MVILFDEIQKNKNWGISIAINLQKIAAVFLILRYKFPKLILDFLFYG